MLSRAADAYDREVETSVSSLTSILEPMMILFGGGVVMFIVMAIRFRIFSIKEFVKSGPDGRMDVQMTNRDSSRAEEGTCCRRSGGSLLVGVVAVNL